ncbi:DMSO/selenate family reductase complex B subunit [Adlercreutzia sp. R25]|uniref:DMSO/selenate family reductase complex B subunit n=1 Tax=Adlercreutzia shanghongiae TaxID=3111773 RepID=A0ABU6IY20_9ACTN|nr:MULTISPECIES: DMSO/selenate family reductase complex B subunit [unclassified Adlercreutzia]MEC4272529.1 DMSO/selenate family reductase complex B subunit [Adlercreutzia sp. R25]MEC4294571.1 DMSO/selenate family reductase complex B subunit [Adlercreutzia sp. R22]
MTQYGFYYNIDDCIGCRTCVIACKDKNDLPVGTKYRRLIEYAGGDWQEQDGVCSVSNFFAYHIAATCNHCANPACVDQCPTGAMTKDPENGIVYVQKDVCIGCGTCAEACPYDVPKVREETNISGKCDMCRDLVAQGEQPACVASCLARCIKWGDIKELRAEYGDVAAIHPFPSPEETAPSVVFSYHHMNPEDREGEIVSPEEELY